MNKAELIEAIAKQTKFSKVLVAKVVNAYHETVKSAIGGGDSVNVVGFGSFSVTERKAKTGRNPKTGAVLKIKAAKVPKFRPGKALKDSVQ